MSDTKLDTERVVSAIVGTIEKNFGKGSLMRLNKDCVEAVEVIPTGSLALDEALGVGGYPRGRIIEIYGPESSGKTTLTLHAIAEMQAKGQIAAFIDAEHAFDPGYAKAIGVDLDTLLISQPDCGEQALDITEALTRSGTVGLIVLDSVAALTPRAEIEGEMGDLNVGGQARLMSRALRKLASITHKTNTTLIFINQLRQKIGVTFGSPETTTGGTALKFYSSVRLDVRRIGKVSVGEKVVGNRTRVKVVKNKVAQPFTEAELDLRWGEGIDAAGDLLDLAVVHDVVQKNGSHYAMGGKSFAQGREKARTAMLGDSKLSSAISKATMARLPAQLRRVATPEPAPTPSPKPEPVKATPRTPSKKASNGAHAP